MKTYTFKKYVVAILIFSFLLFSAMYISFSIDSSSNTMNIEYAKNMGWELLPSPVEISHFKIPVEFDSVYETYNSVQKKSGFDLEPFKGKSVTRYTYNIQNHEMADSMNVFMGIIVFESRIIAADIYSTDMEGFLHGICETEKIKSD